MSEGKVAEATRVSEVLAELQKTQAGLDTNLYKSGIEYQQQLQSALRGTAKGYEDLLGTRGKYKDVAEQILTSQERAAVESNFGEHTIKIQDTGKSGNVGELALRGDGLKGLTERINRELTFEMVPKYRAGDSGKTEISQDLVDAARAKVGDPTKLTDPAAAAVQRQAQDVMAREQALAEAIPPVAPRASRVI